MKIDPYKHKERYLNWKKKTKKEIPKISRQNSDLIKQYLADMENGINISCVNKKGARSYIRLNALKTRMIFLIQQFEAKFNIDNIKDIKEEQLFSFFADMRNGRIKRSTNLYKIMLKSLKLFGIGIKKQVKNKVEKFLILQQI